MLRRNPLTHGPKKQNSADARTTHHQPEDPSKALIVPRWPVRIHDHQDHQDHQDHADNDTP